MIKFHGTHKNGALIAAGVVVVVLILFWFFRPKTTGGRCPICKYLGNILAPGGYSNPAGTTNPGALNGVSGGTGAPNTAFQTYNYNVPVPSFHYAGNQQIYMPLFGFVGYSSTGTM